MISGELTAVLAVFLLTAGLVPLAFSVMDRVVRCAKQNAGRLVRADLLEALGLLLIAGGVALLAILMMARGWFWILEIPFQLTVGWASYLVRVLKSMQPNAVAVASAVVCFVALAVGMHVFLRWFASSWSVSWTAKRTLQLLLLVAVVFASGVAVVGLVQQTGWLIRTPEPLVKDNRQIR